MNVTDIQKDDEQVQQVEEEKTPTKAGKGKKRVVSYPDELLSNDCYSLFLAIYRDRQNVDSLLTEVVKDLKVRYPIHLTPSERRVLQVSNSWLWFST